MPSIGTPLKCNIDVEFALANSNEERQLSVGSRREQSGHRWGLSACLHRQTLRPHSGVNTFGNEQFARKWTLDWDMEIWKYFWKIKII